MLKKVFKILWVTLLIIVILIGLAFALVSPIAKYVVNKNCISWTGRKITLGSLTVNPFNGSVYIKDLKIYEANGDSLFFSCHDIYLQVSLKKMLDKVYEIDKVQIDNPEINIVQNKNHFNFDDIVKRFSDTTKSKPKPKNSPQIEYYVHDVSINNAGIMYNNKPMHNIFRIHELNFKLPDFVWNNPQSKLHLDFNYGTGGAFSVDLDADRKTLAYNLSLIIDKYDLSQYYTPLSTYMKVSSVKGSLSTKLRIHGKLNNPEDFSLYCDLNVKDVEIRDMGKRKIYALGDLSVKVDTINMKQHLFKFKRILIDRPYMALDEFEKGNSISRQVIKQEKPKEEEETKDTAKVKAKQRDYSNMMTFIASSVKSMAIDFLGANYHADSIALTNGEFVFNDYAPHHNFHCSLSRINISTDEIGPKNKKVVFQANALLDDTGKLAIQANLSFDLKKKLFSYNVSKFDVPDLSPIAKYVLEKNSVKWTGRVITTGEVKIKPLKGSIFIKDIKIYEPDSSTVFFDCHYVYVKMNLTQMFNNVYEIDKIKIDSPKISIIQNGNHFNVDDLAKRFSSTDTTQHTTNDTGTGIHYDIKNIIINKGDINFTNAPINHTFKIHEFNFNIPEIIWNNPQTLVHLDFNYGTGGAFNVDLNVNRITDRYTLALKIDNYDLSQYYAPLNTFLRISSLQGSLSTDFRIHGKFNHPEHVSGTGSVNVNNLQINDTANRKVFAMGKFTLDVDTFNVKHGIYYIRNVLLDKPFMRFDYYTNGNNITQMVKYHPPSTPIQDTSTGEIKPDYSNIFTLIASSIKMMTVDLASTDYHTDSVTISNGEFVYTDYTLNTPFHYDITNMNASTDEINAKKKSLQFKLNAALPDTGKFSMYADVSLDLKNMLLSYNLLHMRLSDINPYMEYYAGVPFLDGYMDYQSTDSVINRNLKSSNIIKIVGIRVGKKTNKNSVYHMPVRMAISLLEDKRGDIHLNIPASGNLDDPNYKIGKLVGRILSELVIKTAESPFKLLAKVFDKKPEDLSSVTFDYLLEKFSDKELRKLEDIYKVLDKKKEMGVEIIQVTDTVEEKEELAIELAKQQYFLETNHLVNDTNISKRKRRKELKAEEKIATQDTLFDKYLNQKLHLDGTELITVEDKCIRLLGDSMLTRKIRVMLAGRNQQIIDFFINQKLIEPKRIKVAMNKDSSKTQNIIQPEFDIKYVADEEEQQP